MPPLSASKAKRQAEKAAKAASKKPTPREGDSESLAGSTAVGDSVDGTTVNGDDANAVRNEMERLKLATDRCAGVSALRARSPC
jgi:ATP-binding cassette subfamily F protein 2